MLNGKLDPNVQEPGVVFGFGRRICPVCPRVLLFHTDRPDMVLDGNVSGSIYGHGLDVDHCHMCFGCVQDWKSCGPGREGNHTFW